MNVKDCPSCGRESDVKDSRVSKRTGAVRRRRVCGACGRRWHTVEVHEEDVGEQMTTLERSHLRAAASRMVRILDRIERREKE